MNRSWRSSRTCGNRICHLLSVASEPKGSSNTKIHVTIIIQTAMEKKRCRIEETRQSQGERESKQLQEKRIGITRNEIKNNDQKRSVECCELGSNDANGNHGCKLDGQLESSLVAIPLVSNTTITETSGSTYLSYEPFRRLLRSRGQNLITNTAFTGTSTTTVWDTL
ncbi:hypothetical protein Tco_0617901 [Tanacetum coccineum]